MKTKKLIVTLCIMLVIILAKNTNVLALQSTATSGTSSKTDSLANWIKNVRKIEGEAGGGMGLKETIDETTALATSESNNIDVHLQKNTEYGAMALLGASNYGKRAKDADASNCWMQNGDVSTTGTATNLATSTGNISGVYELGYYNMWNTRNNFGWEWTAGGGISFLTSKDTRYKDIYNASGVGKTGDATKDGDIDLSDWHSYNPYQSWVSGAYGFIRGHGDYGIFSRRDSLLGNPNYYGYNSYARAVAVCGTGI